MIKASELRMGSLFYPLSNDDIRVSLDADMFRVEQIWFDAVTATTVIGDNPASRGIQRMFRYSDISPIPLSPEILIRCGFIERGDGFLVKELSEARMSLGFYRGQYDKMTLFQMQGQSYDEAKELRINFGGNHPQFVHQLQSLYFALTGMELNS